jgi:hypothetical protein
MYIKATITSPTGKLTIITQVTRDGWHQQRLIGGSRTPYEMHWDEQATQDIEWIQFEADKYGKIRTINSEKWR